MDQIAYCIKNFGIKLIFFKNYRSKLNIDPKYRYQNDNYTKFNLLISKDNCKKKVSRNDRWNNNDNNTNNNGKKNDNMIVLSNNDKDIMLQWHSWFV